NGANQRQFTRSMDNFKSLTPRFLRDGSLFYLVQGKERGRVVTQIMRAELSTGKVTPVTGTELVISDFNVSPAGDVLALVVNSPLGGKSVNRVYIQSLAPNATAGAVPLAATGAEQQLTPAFMP